MYKKVDTCVNSDLGTKLYHDAVFRTSDLGIKYDAPQLPVISINGEIHTGMDAYNEIGNRICAAYEGEIKEGCGCGSVF